MISDPKFNYESILGEYEPEKTKSLVEVANILNRPVFKTGKKRYAVRVYRYARDSPNSLGTYQIDVRADDLSSLRLKLIKNIPWDTHRKISFDTNVKIYKTYAIDKYNVAGWLGMNYTKSYFVWDPDNDNSRVIVNAMNGRLTSKKYDYDADYAQAKANMKKATVKKPKKKSKTNAAGLKL